MKNERALGDFVVESSYDENNLINNEVESQLYIRKHVHIKPHFTNVIPLNNSGKRYQELLSSYVSSKWWIPTLFLWASFCVIRNAIYINVPTPILILYLVVTLFLSFAASTMFDYQLLKMVITNFEFWYLLLNVIQYCIWLLYGGIKAYDNSEDTKFRILVFDHVPLFLIAAILVLIMDVMINLSARTKQIFILLMTIEYLKLIIFIFAFSQAYHTADVCFIWCTDSLRLSLSSLFVVFVFSAKNAFYKFFWLDRCILIKTRISFHITTQKPDEYDLSVQQERRQQLIVEKSNDSLIEIDRFKHRRRSLIPTTNESKYKHYIYIEPIEKSVVFKYIPVFDIKYSKQITSSKYYVVFVIIWILCNGYFSIYPPTSLKLGVLFLHLPSICLIIIEVGRGEKTLLKQLLFEFQVWYVFVLQIVYCVAYAYMLSFQEKIKETDEYYFRLCYSLPIFLVAINFVMCFDALVLMKPYVKSAFSVAIFIAFIIVFIREIVSGFETNPQTINIFLYNTDTRRIRLSVLMQTTVFVGKQAYFSIFRPSTFAVLRSSIKIKPYYSKDSKQELELC